MEFEYKVTVIVPVYNAEKNIDRTMQSLFQQTIAQELMEVILIDDGSTDNSPCICDRYAEEHDNVRVIHQENKGVSAARNAGIRAARGKYLLYLDSDDTLSPETIKNTTNFFDVHYNETDIVAYPVVFCYNNGYTEHHYRDTIMTRSGVYDVEKTLYINLSTMNVVVKNRNSENLYFNEKRFFHEDEEYITNVVMLSGKIGYVINATYFYKRHEESVTSRFSSPYYIFDSSMDLYEDMFSKYSKDGEISKYIQALLLNDFSWKIAQGKFLPFHYTEDKQKQAMVRIQALLNKIDSRIILGHPQMKEVYKYYLMSLKTQNRPFVYAEKNTFVIADTSGELRNFRDVLTVITRSNIENGKLYLLIHLKCLVNLLLQEKPCVYAVINGYKKIELNTFASAFNYYYSKMRTADFPAAHFEIPLENVKEISFEMGFYGGTYKTKFWFMRTQGLRNSPQYYLTDGKYKVSATADTILVESGQYSAPKPTANRKISFCRALMGRSHQRIWLYFDRMGVYDNAYYQFKHDVVIKDGIKRYYVFDGERTNVRSLFTSFEQTRLVKFNSPLHKVLYSNAEYILTSFVDDLYYRPFDLDTFGYYRGVCKAKVIYLQHGILHAKLGQYRKEKLEIDKVVVSGEYERNLFINECGFRDADLIVSGMPRLDIPDRKQPPGKKILCAPTWRNYLTKGLVNRNWQPVSADELKGSNYFIGLVNLLKDSKLSEGLRKYGYSIELKLHPIFEMYGDIFREALPEIKLCPSVIKEEEYAALITDFSSFLFDFAYLNRPIFNFVPDIAEFRAGLNGYRELYIPLEKGLGFFSLDLNDMVNEIIRSMDRGFMLQSIYKERMDKIFFHYEATHSDALYQYLALKSNKRPG